MPRAYEALQNLDGPATRINSLQDMDCASIAGGDTNADQYNPTRTTDYDTVGWYMTFYADPANTDKIYIVPVEDSVLQVGDVVSQATEVLSAGMQAKLFIPAGDDTLNLAQYAAGDQNQALRIELFEVKERRS